MKFTPKTEEQIASENIWSAGVYGFEITHAENAISKSGNEMIKLTLRVFDAEGRERTMFDYLLESMAYKLRHAAEACGLLERYNVGELDGYDFMGKAGSLKLSVRANSQSRTKENSIQDYVVHRPDSQADASNSTAPVGHPIHDALPWD